MAVFSARCGGQDLDFRTSLGRIVAKGDATNDNLLLLGGFYIPYWLE